MWCIIICVVLSLIAGVVCAFIDWDFGKVAPCTFLGAIAGVLLAFVISVGTWIFAPDTAYEFNEIDNYILKETDAGELLYFNVTHDESDTYLYYMNEDQTVQKVYLSDVEVKFIEDGQPTRIEVYKWQYKSGFLRATACLPLTRWNNTTYIYISESNWLKHTKGGIEHVITHPIQD